MFCSFFLSKVLSIVSLNCLFNSGKQIYLWPFFSLLPSSLRSYVLPRSFPSSLPLFFTIFISFSLSLFLSLFLNFSITPSRNNLFIFTSSHPLHFLTTILCFSLSLSFFARLSLPSFPFRANWDLKYINEVKAAKICTPQTFSSFVINNSENLVKTKYNENN